MRTELKLTWAVPIIVYRYWHKYKIGLILCYRLIGIKILFKVQQPLFKIISLQSS